jgi:hypothetical protein
MATISEIKKMIELADLLELENAEILHKYTPKELTYIYNGIGPDSFPNWLREFINCLNPTLEVAAFIHDVEWHETNKSKATFKESNDRLTRNGITLAKHEYSWFNPIRYKVLLQAKKFGRICQLFGFNAWQSDCACKLCQKKRAQEVKKTKNAK